jgi:hypothetical protein
MFLAPAFQLATSQCKVKVFTFTKPVTHCIHNPTQPQWCQNISMTSATPPPSPPPPPYDFGELSSSSDDENPEYGLPLYFESEYPEDNPNDWLPPSYTDDECPPEYYTLAQARLCRRARGLAALTTTRGRICEQIDSSSIARINSYFGGKSLQSEH